MIELQRVLEEGGITLPTLKFYRKMGLIGAPEVKGLGMGKGKVSRYPDDTVERIKAIRHYRRLGLSIPSIRTYLNDGHVIPGVKEPSPHSVEVKAPANPDIEATAKRLWEEVERLLPGKKIRYMRFVGSEEKGEITLYVAGALYTEES